MFYIVGLGNPGEEYDDTRHNAGRMVAAYFAKRHDIGAFEFDKIANSEIAVGKVGKEKAAVILPNTFMNKSGDALRKNKELRIKNKGKIKEIGNLAVIHDDLDIPFGKMKVSFNKSSGGHRGVESIIKTVKTEAFVRIRIGISPATSSGKIKKPKGEEAVGKFILAKFKPAELTELKKISALASDAIDCLISEGKEKAMSLFNL